MRGESYEIKMHAGIKLFYNCSTILKRLRVKILYIRLKYNCYFIIIIYNIYDMEEFGIPNKLVAHTKIYMERTKYQVMIDSTLSDDFTEETNLKQGDALSPLLFNSALEKAAKLMQSE